MKNLLIYSLFLLLAFPFGAWPFISASLLVFFHYFYLSRDKRAFVFLISSIFSLLYLPLAIISIFILIFVADDEPFIKVSVFLSALILIFILFPIVYLFVIAPPTSISGPLISVIVTSIVAATISTLIGIFFSLPLGYIMARKDFAGKGFIEGLIDVPIVIPHTVAGILILLIFGSSGIIGAPLESIGIKFYYVLPGIIVAMLFVSIPFLINQVRNGIEKVDERYEYVAMNLGASRTRAFFDVVLPQIKKNILSGSINSWARAMSEFGAVIMIAFYPMVAPTYIYYLFSNFGLKASLPATSFLLVVTLSIFVILRVISGRYSDVRD